MDYLSVTDVRCLQIAAAGLAYATVRPAISRLISQKPQPVNFSLLQPKTAVQKQTFTPTRRIKKQLEQTARQCTVFYGSQTGTAERFALRFAKEASARFSLACLVADLDSYDFDELNLLGPDHLAVFILATYGEGEPTDNAMAFEEFMRLTDAKASQEALASLQYSAFGLGSSSYQLFNAMIRRTDSILQASGATRIGDLGLGDDGKGTIEDDFESWKTATLTAIAQQKGIAEKPYEFKSNFVVSEDVQVRSHNVLRGEPNKAHLRNKIMGPFTAQNPLPAPIVAAHELFTSPPRNCLHMEFDISGTTLSYDTGDRLAVWPINSDLEVFRFLQTFGLWEKRNSVIEIKSLDPTIPVPIPSPTTYEAVARSYLDVAAPINRGSLLNLASFLPEGPVKSQLLVLGSDIALFRREITDKYYNLAQLLSRFEDNQTLAEVPFSFILEILPKLQPRYYSISSSSQCSRKTISITAIVDAKQNTQWEHEFKGVSTSYLLALKNDFASTSSCDAPTTVATHQITGPRGQYSSPTALIHVRRSKFRLPRSSSTPIIMIGPGTGVAPFRAFVQERARAAQLGSQVGRTVLFYGCRSEEDDFLYKDEWQSHAKAFSQGTFSLHVAFSRQLSQKVYVQDLVSQQAEELKSLVLEQNAVVYVCGDASRMAKDVFKSFAKIVEGGNVESGEAYLRGLKATGRWFEDVW